MEELDAAVARALRTKGRAAPVEADIEASEPVET
jgi:hypothetical protein